MVPGAEVVARGVATGQVTSVQTNQSGVYSISFLNPGQYEVSCEHPGFKKFVRAGIVLETGTTSTIDIVLDLGQLSDVVNVSPCFPPDWDTFNVHYRYRETVYHIAVTQTRAVSAGTAITVDGIEQDDKGIPLVDDRQEHWVDVRIVPQAASSM